ncbi:hypothetical protein BFP72_17635 [Reichenbachiella sp. 5M10]|uniref:hypothetical protein n=1 Tax=Reichenbachiella sp. 5M10 TaxID=1889772 RepID=UPI000C14A969|nr:hypothetical protein [Reichenbachiella sp. 5M10]PIB37097.1 hypothetical protein BFP72_17635 [Reichenbachiella sp. 5M10]
MSHCVTGKNCYDSLGEAEQALIENWIRYQHEQESGPRNVYLCDDCGTYHFTSRGELSDVILDNLSYIKSQRIAREWERKLR